jgi:hypothetical protein
MARVPKRVCTAQLIVFAAVAFLDPLDLIIADGSTGLINQCFLHNGRDNLYFERNDDRLHGGATENQHSGCATRPNEYWL